MSFICHLNSCFRYEIIITRSSRLVCSEKVVFSKTSQKSQENTCAAGVFFNKVPGLQKRLKHRYYPVNF